MPLYPYRCTQCGHQYEKVQKFNAEPETVCPECGGPVERPLTAPALQFKGSGWYVTDYGRNGKSSSSEEATNKPAQKSDSKTESKSETKPAVPAAAPSKPN